MVGPQISEFSEVSKLVNINESSIKKRKFPVIGPYKCFETLTDNDGNIIPLKIETGIYWIPDKITNLESPEFTYLKVDLNRASSKAKRHSIATLWRWRNEGFKDT